MRIIRNILAVLAGTAAIFLAFGSAPASAAAEGLEYSVNGSVWSTTPPTALFPGGYRIVPGERIESTIFVRSAHSTPVRFTAVIRGVSWTDSSAVASFFLAGSDQDGPGLTATAAGSIVDCTALVSSRVLAPGSAVRLTVTVSMPAIVTGTAAQSESANFTLQLGFTDPAAATTPGGCPIPDEEANVHSVPSYQDGTGERLGYTGVLFVPETLAATAAVTVLGLLLLARRRRADSDLGAVERQNLRP